MKILITGGAGFIGSHVADRYLELGHDVVVVDDLSTGNPDNFSNRLRFYRVSIGSPEMQAIFDAERPEIVNHFAAQISVRKSVDDPVSDAHINILGTLNLLGLCHRYNVRKIIFSSTGGAMYGEQQVYPADESHVANPYSPYGIAKLAIEKYIQFYDRTYRIPFVILRYSNVYGPRQNGYGEAGVIAIFMERILKQDPLIIYGDGKQTRDYVYIKDVVDCNVRALDSDIKGLFHVSTGIEININTIVQHLCTLVSSDVRYHYAPPKAGEQQRSCLKPGLLQIEPPIAFFDGLKETVSWFMSKNHVNL